MTIIVSEEIVLISSLSPHPENYCSHPDDQIEHLMQSIRENGIYKNVVCAQDYTILAGHGIIEAAKRLGLTEFPIRRLQLDPFDPLALKILIGDNEGRRLVDIDDRQLTDMLKAILDSGEGLLGTGFDQQMLANLVYVTRPASEIKSFDTAEHWAGLPEYESIDEPIKLSVNFRNEDDRKRFCDLLGITITDKTSYIWWPERVREDPSSLRFDG